MATFTIDSHCLSSMSSLQFSLVANFYFLQQHIIYSLTKYSTDGCVCGLAAVLTRQLAVNVAYCMEWLRVVFNRLSILPFDVLSVIHLLFKIYCISIVICLIT